METTSDVMPTGCGGSPIARPARFGELPQEGRAQVRTVSGVWPADRCATGKISPPSKRRNENPGRASRRNLLSRATTQEGRAPHGRPPHRAKDVTAANSLPNPVLPIRQRGVVLHL